MVESGIDKEQNGKEEKKDKESDSDVNKKKKQKVRGREKEDRRWVEIPIRKFISNSKIGCVLKQDRLAHHKAFHTRGSSKRLSLSSLMDSVN